MRKLLFALVLVAIAVVALGFYRGWFTYKTTHDPETGREGIQLEMNKNKTKEDLDKVKNKIGGGKSQGGEKSEQNEKPEQKEP